MSNEELVQEIQNGNQSLMEQLWGNVYRLVYKLAMNYHGLLGGHGGLTIEDLVQEGYPALAEAVETYKPDVAAFSTWLCIYLRKNFRIAAGLHGKAKTLDPINTKVSLNATIDDEGEAELMEVVEDPAAAMSMGNTEDRIWLEQLREVIGSLMAEMPEKQAEALYHRYWLNQSYTDAGEDLGIAGWNVHTAEQRGLRFLRQPKNAKHLKPFYDFDYYGGAGMGAFKHSGMSVQERYLIRQEKAAEVARRI